MIAWTDDELALWRQRCDPIADAVIADLYATHGLAAANRVLAGVVINDQPDPTTLPPPLAEYLRTSDRLPPWADGPAIVRAQAMFAERGPLVLLALVTASLAECYALGNGVQVLYQTHRMDERHVTRRVFETAQFLVDVGMPGGLASGGRGLRAIQKVRLMHGSVRHLLLAPVPPGHDHASRHFVDVLLGTTWDTRALGLPINWQDQAFTLTSFSWVVLRCLERMGSPCTAQEQADWMHLWAVVGFVLGIEESLIPHTVAEGERLYWRIRSYQQRATPEGRALTRALGTFLGQELGGAIGGKTLATVLLRWLCDDQTNRLLGVRPLDTGDRLLLALLHGVVRLFFRHPEDATHLVLGRWLVERLTALPRGWDRGLFAIPDHLIGAWRHPRPHPPLPRIP